ncbi:hypothetical protein BDV37DRAFT_110573 [Aspergillus pseudonomiae]|uniref:Uncharacterized protein n=1 Tax=Aspergillus pseudonomiae TaxID=1506151 RepID=A0A5N7DS13_9EURO|nr:uncharacterized protein BDV37DRAFT_110573 [Aspergillus pseudonomiae]KAE8409267.1 hypothetical protein BDV37DRAFT_110573 [Aspergillus pseudonomiae]
MLTSNFLSQPVRSQRLGQHLEFFAPIRDWYLEHLSRPPYLLRHSDRVFTPVKACSNLPPSPQGPEVSRRPLLWSGESLTAVAFCPLVLKSGGLNPCRLARARQAVFRQSGSPMAGSPFSGGSGPTAQRPHTQRIQTGRCHFAFGARPN